MAREFTPEHLLVSDEEHNALGRSKVGPLEGKAITAANKVFETFKQRRMLAGHLFYNGNLSDWHFFYFDQRDRNKRGNHWGAGPHIHLINHLWPNWSAEHLWNHFNSGNVQMKDALHMRFIEDTPKIDGPALR